MEDQTFSVKEDAGNRVDMAVRHVQRRDGIKDYASALKVAARENPVLFESYLTGRRVVRNYEHLGGAEQRMLELQSNPQRVRREANDILDHHAKLIAGGPNSRAGIAQLSPESYRNALEQLKRQFPSLSRASEDGFISATDWSLLALLEPGVASDIKNRFGVDQLNLRAGNYQSQSRSHVYRDERGEVRRYVR